MRHEQIARMILGTAMVLAGLASPAAAQTPANSCEGLQTLSLAGGAVTSAQTVGAGQFVPPPNGPGGRGPVTNPFADVPVFCRVMAQLKPIPDSDIRIEVWLRAAGWNGKLQVVGNGGFAGAIGYAALGQAVRDGYAAASTDTGHTGGDPSFMTGHPERVVDFAHRAIHELAVASKSTIASYYGSAPRLSYFNGCSTGGRQALTAAQRYPTDFDGIIAGAAANSTVRMTSMQLFSGLATQVDPASTISVDKQRALHAAVLNACDGRDGVRDGVLENPAACTFEPRQVACTAGDGGTCLTEAQVAAARKIYSGPVNPRTKQSIFPGLARGSETGWNGLSGDQPFAYAQGMWRYALLNDPNWDYRLLDFDAMVAEADRTAEKIGIQAVNTNLQPFFARGGKLLMYHGWNDPLISPFNSVNYYKGVLAATKSTPKAEDSVRLFMMPGVNHCQGGAGTDTWDKVAVLDAWRDKGQAPSQVVASHATDGKVDRTRPLCAYPKVAAYKGSGDTDDAANFICK
jgi:feruloyl esterase